MALVNKLVQQNLEKDSKHSIVDCTYTVIQNNGENFLQIDTYGSSQRKIKGKKSQSIRFSKEAISQLKKIISEIEAL